MQYIPNSSKIWEKIDDAHLFASTVSYSFIEIIFICPIHRPKSFDLCVSTLKCVDKWTFYYLDLLKLLSAMM